jgi:hypothetical protein
MLNSGKKYSNSRVHRKKILNETINHNSPPPPLDYGNALLYNVNSSVIERFQRVQNTAARMITRK